MESEEFRLWDRVYIGNSPYTLMMIIVVVIIIIITIPADSLLDVLLD